LLSKNQDYKYQINITDKLQSNIIHIKNMVCNRCIKVVRDELSQMGFNINHIELGKVELKEKPNDNQLKAIGDRLLKNGFELIEDNKSIIIEKIKTLIINIIHHNREIPAYLNFSDILSREIGYDYPYLSSLFSSVMGITIEKYIILQKIEKVKELLVYDELNLNEIAFQLNYSSVQHLSSQFKKTTGLTPSYYKKIKENKRKPLDRI
jgi:AraC family transcriptional regulator